MENSPCALQLRLKIGTVRLQKSFYLGTIIHAKSLVSGHAFCRVLTQAYKEHPMTRTSILAVAGVLSIFSVAPAIAADAPTAEQCAAWFTKADTNADGSLGKGENMTIVEAMNKAGGTTMKEDDMMGKEAFLAACGKGTLGMPAAQ
jgi:hypothetical protein